jgi:hypothetical protein
MRTLGLEPQHPQVLHSARGESRSVVIALRAGEGLPDHQVHERAHVVVIDGDIEISSHDGVASGGPGTFAVCDPVFVSRRRQVPSGGSAKIVGLAARARARRPRLIGS